METCQIAVSTWTDEPRVVADDDAISEPAENGSKGGSRPVSPLSVTYISYGVATATRAHNLQTVHTLNALIERGVRVTFINPMLHESPGMRKERNLPAGRNVLLKSAAFFARHCAFSLKGRFWSLFLDRTRFALEALWHARKATADVLVTRDVVVAFWLARLRFLHKVPVVYEVHTLEQIMFAKEERANGPATSATRYQFSGSQKDTSGAGKAYEAFIRRIENWTIRHADAVITLTRALAEKLARELGIETPRVVCSGHALGHGAVRDKTALRRRLGLPLDRKIAVYAGLSFRGKGVDLLFAAARRLPPDCLVVVIGGEAEDADPRRAEAAANLLFVPRIAQAGVRDYLHAADAGLLLYPRSEFLACFSSPVKLFEYLACGLPVIATDLPATREVIRQGWNGVLVDSEDAGTLASVVAATLRDETRLRAMAARALSCAQRYSYAARADRLLDVLARCTARRAGPCS